MIEKQFELEVICDEIKDDDDDDDDLYSEHVRVLLPNITISF